MAAPQLPTAGIGRATTYPGAGGIKISPNQPNPPLKLRHGSRFQLRISTYDAVLEAEEMRNTKHFKFDVSMWITMVTSTNRLAT